MFNYSYMFANSQDDYVKTELLISKELSSTTIGKDVFDALDNFSNRIN